MKPYEERLADAKAMYAQGKENLEHDPMPKGQKFPPGVFIKIDDKLCSMMSHFTSGVYAKVESTYAHLYGGSNVRDYSLIIQYEKGNWSSAAWYFQDQLTLVTDEKILKELEEDLMLSMDKKAKKNESN